ncbi:MAG: polyphosphate kinase, partial [Pirellula sp.]
MIKSKRIRRESSPSQYINRELSWLSFNYRVLAEAQNPENPLLERLKFLAIFESNLDEFYMVRVSGLIEQLESGYSKLTPDGLSVSEQIEKIQEVAIAMRQYASAVFQQELMPMLNAEGIRIQNYKDLTPRKRREMDEYFKKEIFPVCTPLVLYPATTTPFISNRSLNLAVVLVNPKSEICLARVKIPSILPRAIRTSNRTYDFVMIEDIIANNLDALFPGVEIRGAYPFRVIRDADIEIRELEAADLLTAVEEMTRRRRFGAPVRIDLHPTMPPKVRSRLLGLLELDDSDAFELSGLIGIDFLWELTAFDLPKHKYPAFSPYQHECLATSESIFETIRKSPVIGHQPFDSFRPVEEFIASAAKDAKVIGIKQSLYRVGTQSPIVESLLEAAEEGKQVAVMVELKARFDENNNV